MKEKKPTPDLSRPTGSAEEPAASDLRLTASYCGASGRGAKGGAGTEEGAFKRRGGPGPDPDAGSTWTRRCRGTPSAPQRSGSSSSRDCPRLRWTETVIQVAAAVARTHPLSPGGETRAGECSRKGASEEGGGSTLSAANFHPSKALETVAEENISLVSWSGGRPQEVTGW